MTAGFINNFMLQDEVNISFNNNNGGEEDILVLNSNPKEMLF